MLDGFGDQPLQFLGQSLRVSNAISRLRQKTGACRKGLLSQERNAPVLWVNGYSEQGALIEGRGLGR